MNFASIYLWLGSLVAAYFVTIASDKIDLALTMFHSSGMPIELLEFIEDHPKIFLGIVFVMITFFWPFFLFMGDDL